MNPHSRHYAAIEYSGYTDEVKEKENTDKLKKILNEQNIEIVGDSKILVYNSPYKIVFRRNEISNPHLLQLNLPKNEKTTFFKP